MQKYIWTTLVLFLFYACSVPAPTVEKPVVAVDTNKSTNSVEKSEEQGAKIVPSSDIMNEPVVAPKKVVEEVVTEPLVTSSEEFVPEHIKNSHIEVVEHY